MVHLKTSGKLILCIFGISFIVLVIQVSQLNLDNPPPSRIQSRRTFSIPEVAIETGDLEVKEKYDRHPLGEFLEGKGKDLEIPNKNKAGNNYDMNEIEWAQSEDKKVKSKVISDNDNNDKIQNLEKKYKFVSTDHVEKLDGASCAFLLKEDNLIRNCITGKPIAVKTHKEIIKTLEISKEYKPENVEKRKESFQGVFDTRAWGHSWDLQYKGMNASGRGATLDWALEATAALHVIINQIKRITGKTKIKMLDLPCGDMQWMAKFLRTRDDVDYTGIDIVPDLINDHLKTYRSESWKFKLVDVLETGHVDNYDLIFCRMLFQHLFYADIVKMLKLFSDSKSSYLLTTTFATKAMNEELYMDDNPGRVRPINLQIPPFSLPAPLCLQRDGPGGRVFEGWSHQLGLWKLPVSQLVDCGYIYFISLQHSQYNIYTCTELKDTS